jgi:raffinose/stachyose/melibiose transport system permease protein
MSAAEDERLAPRALAWRYALLLTMAAVVLMPLAAALLGGFKSLSELRADPFGLPETWRWQQYAGILATSRYWRMMGNSLLMAGGTTLLTLLLASMAAFTFSHLRFWGQRFLLQYVMLGLLFPAATAILPLFIQVRDLGLLDRHLGVVLPSVAFSLGAAILLLRGAFRVLPTELLDAALIDGASYLRFFWQIVLPLSRPILATVGVITFVQSWNGYLMPLILLNSVERFPWPLGIMAYQGEFGTDWPLVLAYVTLTILPVVVLFLVAQRALVAGLGAGAVKG